MGIRWAPADSNGEALAQERAEPGTFPSSPLLSANVSGPPFWRAEGKSHLRGFVPSTSNTSVRPTPQSALPERNITIQAFALVQTSAELKANLLKTFASPFKGPLQSKALSLLTVQSWLPPAGWRQAFRAHPLWLFSTRLLSGLFLHFARGLSFPSFLMLLTFTGKHQSDSSEIMLRMIWGCATPLDSLL